MPIDANNQSNFSFNGMPKPQKTAVISLSLFAVFILVFWLWQFQAKLKSPFNPPDGYTASSTSSSTPDAKDTDHDGLTDEQENMYGTSPYLADTDSDGLSDSEEILNGTDPNCPQGQNCFRSDNIDTSSIYASSTASSSESVDSTDTLSAEESAALNTLISGQGDAASIRQFLLDNGATEADLENISDAQLLSTYQQVVQDNLSSQ